MLRGKKILIGLCGSIAAYKTALLTRLLVKEGAKVKIVMTPASIAFITPLTLSTLSKNPVLHEFQANDQGEWNNHVEQGLWADVIVIAPLTANTLAKMAGGICDNLLLATYLSARCPVFVAPAMDLDMYKHQSTNANLSTLKNQGVYIIEPEFGELASGLEGTGRMAEPAHIVAALSKHFRDRQSLRNKKILVTAGPTFEKIDPVRFIGNYSSGKMGAALVSELHARGANVSLILGPVSESLDLADVNITRVVSAEEMFEAAIREFVDSDVAVLAAAVADYTPASPSKSKIKKGERGSEISLGLKETPDIAAHLGKLKKNGQMIIGFALETDNEEENAAKKLESKNFDFIVLNSMRNEGAGFGYDTNQITIIDRDNNVKEFELKNKNEVAKDIVNEIVERIH